MKPWQRQFRRACAAADLFRRFEHENRMTTFGKAQCGGEAIRAGPHHDGVEWLCCHIGYSRSRGSEQDRRSFASGIDGDVLAHAHCPLDRGDFRVGALWVVMEQQHPADSAHLAQRDGVVGCRVAVVNSKRQLAGGVLGIMDQQVGAATQLHRSIMVRTEAVGPGVALRSGAVVGHVREAAPCIADPVPHRAPSLVRDLARQHRESLDGVHPLVDRAERP